MPSRGYLKERFQGAGSRDLLSESVGDFGKWQLKISILMALVKFPIAWFQMSIVFLAPPTNFWCQKLKELHNVTQEEWQSLVQLSDDGLKQTGINTGYCFINQSVLMTTGANLTDDEVVKCAEFGYSQSVFARTITSEWDLVCERQSLMDLSQVVLMFGVLLGNIIFGILADKKGRKRILQACLTAQALFGVLASVSPYFPLFVVLRFFLALANGGTMVTSFVLCMEVVGGKWRTIVPILYQIPFGLGNALLAVFAYYLRDWRHLHLTVSLLSAVYVSMFWLVPESPRWLMTVGRREQAFEVLRCAAHENGLGEEQIQVAMGESYCMNPPQTRFRGGDGGGVKGLFATRTLRRRCLVLFTCWSLAGVTFYAFLQYIGHISDNLFLAVCLGGLSSIPGTILCVVLVMNYGRKLTITYSFLLTALSSLLILAFPRETYSFDWPRMLLAGISIIGLSVSLPAMYLFTGELCPTTLRNSGVGMCMMFSRLGSMLAPMVVSLQSVAGSAPLLVIGGLVLIQAGLLLPLPETQGRNLPETVEDLISSRKFLDECNNMRKPKRKTLTPKDIVVY